MKRRIVAALVLALGAAPGAAEASSVLKVKDGKARRAHDPLLPPRSKTALPVVPRRTVMSRRAQRAPLARSAALTPTERATYTSALTDAKRDRDGLTGTRRSELSAVIATAEGGSTRAAS